MAAFDNAYVNPEPYTMLACRRHQMAAFGDTYDVVAVDMRGYNDSYKPQVGVRCGVQVCASGF